MKKILVVIGFILMGLGLYLLTSPKEPTPPAIPNLKPLEQDIAYLDERLKVVEGEANKFGAISIPDAPYLLQTSLAEPITTAATSMTLNNGTVRGGSTLTGYQCFTVDGGKVEVEYICGTASGTAVTALVRGIDPINPAATSSAAIYAHRRGADVRTTDFPIVQILKRLNNGQDSYPSRLSYDSTIATSTFTTYNLVNKQYVDGVALQGAPTATTTGDVVGIIQLATRTQLSNGTNQSGAYTLVPSAGFFNYTPQSATTVPVSNASGKIAQGWLNLAEAWTFTATTTLAATSSAPLTLRGVNYVFPASQGSASSTLTNDGSGNLRWVVAPTATSGIISDLVTTASANNDVTITTGFQAKIIKLYYFIQGFDGGGTTGYTGRKGIAVYNGNTGALIFDNVLFAATADGDEMSGDDGAPGNVNDFLNITNSTSTITTGPTVSTTLSIPASTSTGFTIRRATVGNASNNARAKISWEAY